MFCCTHLTQSLFSCLIVSNSIGQMHQTHRKAKSKSRWITWSSRTNNCAAMAAMDTLGSITRWYKKVISTHELQVSIFKQQCMWKNIHLSDFELLRSMLHSKRRAPVNCFFLAQDFTPTLSLTWETRQKKWD